MKSKNYFNNYAIWLFLALMLISCSPRRLNFLEKPAEISYKNNSLQSGEKTLFKARPSVFPLREKRIILTQDSLSLNDIKYYSEVLRESEVKSNSIIAIIKDSCYAPHRIILQKRDEESLDIDFQYYFDIDNQRWRRIGVSFFEKTESPSFGRKLFLFKEQKRIIIRDDFADIHIVYVIQGVDKHSREQATIITWDPTRFSSLFGLVSYIQENIDPISFSIGVNIK